MISKYISLKEATHSQTATRKGLDNNPTAEHLENMKFVASETFDKLREWYGKPIGISSFYRGDALNKAIGGSKTSQHCSGLAIDIDADIINNGITNNEIFDWLRENVEFDQLILEYPNEKGIASWIHVSKVRNGNRKQVLKAERINGKTVYSVI